MALSCEEFVSKRAICSRSGGISGSNGIFDYSDLLYFREMVVVPLSVLSMVLPSSSVWVAGKSLMNPGDAMKISPRFTLVFRTTIPG